MTTTLNDIPVGESATIRSFTSTLPQLRHKLLSLGVMPGAEVTVKRVAPLGDPIQIQLRGTSISLRRQEAAILVVTPQSI